MPAKGENGARQAPSFQPTSDRTRCVERRLRLFVNGEAKEVGAATTIEALVALLGLDRRKLAVERNLEIVPRSAFGSTALTDGDRIEIVAFVGGG
jgi:sulfur carrier protein